MLPAIPWSSYGKGKTSRAMLRAIERAAIEADYGESLEVQSSSEKHESTNGFLVVSLDTSSKAMHEQVDAFLNRQLFEANRCLEEAYLAQKVMKGCLQRVKESPALHRLSQCKVNESAMIPLVWAKAETSRVFAHDMGYSARRPTAAKLEVEGLSDPYGIMDGWLKASEPQIELLRSQVSEFLKQQVWEVKRRYLETKAAHHVLKGCLQRVKEQKLMSPSCNTRLLQCVRSTPSISSAFTKKRHEHKLVNLVLRRDVSDICKAPERSCTQRLQSRFNRFDELKDLKAALAASKAAEAAAKAAEAAAKAAEVAASRKSDELQVRVDSLSQENAELSCMLVECRKESDCLMSAAVSKEKVLSARLKEKQDQVEHLQIETLQLRHSLAERGDANAVIRCLDALQRDYDKLVEEHEKLKKSTEVRFTTPSARVLNIDTLMLGIEAEEEARSGAEMVNKQYADMLKRTGCRQAVSMVRARFPIDACSVPVCVKVTLENNGDSEWPQTLAAVCVSGDTFGCPIVPLSVASPGEHFELSMDFAVTAGSEPGETSSMWALVNAGTGVPLGPLLVFEAVWI
jgi:hypothetical protein